MDQGSAESDVESGACPLDDNVAPFATLTLGLKIQNGRERGKVLRVRTNPFVIGRQEDCQLRVNVPTVSRTHASIETRDGAFFLRDLATTNGTFLNGRFLRDAEVELSDGDVIHVGPLRLGVILSDQGLEPTVAEEQIAGWLRDEDEHAEDDDERFGFTLAEPQSEEATRFDVETSLLHLKTERVEDVLIITPLAPRLLDETTIGPLRLELLALLEKPLPRQVVVNLERVSAMSSRAVGVLMAHFLRLDRSGGGLRICRVHPRILALLERIRLPMLVEVFPNVDDAVLSSWT